MYLVFNFQPINVTSRVAQPSLRFTLVRVPSKWLCTFFLVDNHNFLPERMSLSLKGEVTKKTVAWMQPPAIKTFRFYIFSSETDLLRRQVGQMSSTRSSTKPFPIHLLVPSANQLQFIRRKGSRTLKEAGRGDEDAHSQPFRGSLLPPG